MVGARTSVWQFASVIRGAVIGADCNIASGACIDGSTVGDRTKIAHNLAMGPGFVIGNDCFIAPNCVLCNDAWPRAHTLGFDVKAYEGRPAIIMEDGSTIGAGAVVLPGVRIGAGAMVAAGSVVARDVPPLTLWKGVGEITDIEGEERKRRIRFAGG
jgi:acetyltransferase-like isoleucine patch superfamily enzyme